MNRSKILLCLTLCILAVTIFVDIANACPTCSDSLTQSEQGRRMIDGYFWSILFMMAMPFTILAGFGGYMYRIVAKAKAKEKAELDEKKDESLS